MRRRGEENERPRTNEGGAKPSAGGSVQRSSSRKYWLYVGCAVVGLIVLVLLAARGCPHV